MMYVWTLVLITTIYIMPQYTRINEANEEIGFRHSTEKEKF
jgi:hypothetical protein